MDKRTHPATRQMRNGGWGGVGLGVGAHRPPHAEKRDGAPETEQKDAAPERAGIYCVSHGAAISRVAGGPSPLR